MSSIQQNKGTEVKKSRLLSRSGGLKHGFFNRFGGVSPGVYDSLNCSPGSNDAADNVHRNRDLAKRALGLEAASLYGLSQIHSTRVHVITPDMPIETENGFPEGDALVTEHKNLALSVLGADCAPLLFAAHNKPVVAAAHAGWKGAVSGIVAEVVKTMQSLGAEAESLSVCIGPTIHQESYEVREDFINQLNALSPFDAAPYLREQSSRFYFNLPGYLEKQCQLSGIGRIENLGLDTYTREEFFSFRRNTHAGEKEYGRQISIIALC